MTKKTINRALVIKTRGCKDIKEPIKNDQSLTLVIYLLLLVRLVTEKQITLYGSQCLHRQYNTLSIYPFQHAALIYHAQNFSGIEFLHCSMEIQ